MTMPDIDLDAIEARLAGRTPGDWEAGETHHYHEGTYHERYTEVEPNIAAGLRPADADLIAHAPTDLAALLAELRATTADLAVAVEVARERGEEVERLRQHVSQALRVIDDLQDERALLRAVAKAAREHVAAEKDTDLPRIGRAHDAMESALDAWRAGGEGA